MSAAKHPPPPWAALIRLGREARGMTVEEAASQLPPGVIKARRWGQIERGYERTTPFIPAKASGRALAHMARVVGVSPEQLEETDRPDAAEILREIQRQEAEREQPPAATLEERIAELGQRLQALPSSRAEARQLREEAERLLEEWRRTDGGRERSREPGAHRRTG